MNCTLCEKQNFTEIEDAIEDGWLPYFFCGDQEYGPVCPVCSEKYVEPDKSGEFKIKEIFEKTFLDSASSCRTDKPLAEMPEALDLYPDRKLIKKLREKFILVTITDAEKIDLINHQHQLIRDLDRLVEATIEERDEAYNDL